jgi:hypothetical protein
VKRALPYSLGIAYNTELPNSSARSKVSLETSFKKRRARVGETVRLSGILKNKTPDGLPMTMAILGVPAGFTAQPWQLKELQEKKLIDFYEVIGNEVAVYYRQMKPEETREIHLDLKAEIPGRYEAPASRAYLYYTNEDKVWVNYGSVEVVN